MTLHKFPTYFFMLISLALVLGACEADLKLDGLETQPKLVVNSLFSPDSVWVVHISKTRNIFADPKGNRNVNHASVIITDEDSGESYDLISKGEGCYSLKLLKPIPGRKYNIEVKADGYESVFARDETPFPVEVNFVKEEVVKFDGNDVLKVDFEIIDRGGQDNYYVWELLVTKINDEGNEGESVKDIALIGSFDSNVDYISNGDKEQNKLFITDLHFDGSNYNASFYTNPNFNYPGNPEDDPGITFEKQLRISVISRNYYLHLRSLELYQNSSPVSSTVSQPAEIFSNIENGLGIFGGFYEMELNF